MPEARYCAMCGHRLGSERGDVGWWITGRRTFGVVPGRARRRALRVRLQRMLGVVRARIGLAAEIVRARLEAQRKRFGLRRGAAQLSRERADALRDLGETVLRDDGADLARAKARVLEIDSRLGALSDDLVRVDEVLLDRTRRARSEGGATEASEPVPAPVPEPAPVPSDPPGPVIVPEPEPVPHEPPGPVIVPEPEPPES
jgi:hypothetical protein